jgi:hypothetical protein
MRKGKDPELDPALRGEKELLLTKSAGKLE